MGHTVLITGANGLLGRALRATLSKYNFTVIATGLGVDSMAGVAGVYEEMDITIESNCEKILHKYHPEFIVNAAFKHQLNAPSITDTSYLSVETRTQGFLSDSVLDQSQA